MIHLSILRKITLTAYTYNLKSVLVELNNATNYELRFNYLLKFVNLKSEYLFQTASSIILPKIFFTYATHITMAMIFCIAVILSFGAATISAVPGSYFIVLFKEVDFF